MKNYQTALILLLSLTISSCASLKVVPTEQIIIQKVFELPGLTQKQIYDKAAEWISKKYISSKEVIQLKDPNNGKIIGRGITYFTNVWVKIPCEYLINIEAKDGKCRVTCEQFIGLWGEHQNNRKPLVEEGFVNEVKSNLSILIADLNLYLKENKQDNW